VLGLTHVHLLLNAINAATAATTITIITIPAINAVDITVFVIGCGYCCCG